MERQLHDALGAWAEDHASRYEYVDVSDYAPKARPEQRIDSFKTPLDERILFLPAEQLQSTLQERYEAELGSSGRAVVAAFNARGVVLHGSLTETLIDFLRRGKSVAILSPHADRLEDIGVFAAALAIAMGDPKLIRQNGLILNKVMTRELYRGVPMADMFLPFGSIYWVIPDTASAGRWGIPYEIKRYVNLNAMRTLLADLAQGAIITFAPTGTLMQRERDAAGRPRALRIPPIAPGSLNLVARFDAYVIAVQWQDQVAFSPVTAVPGVRGASRTGYQKNEAELLGGILATMAALTRELAGVPVAYSCSSHEK